LAIDGYFCWPQMDTLTWPRTQTDVKAVAGKEDASGPNAVSKFE